MSLTFGTGPLAGQSAGAFNFDVASAPKHRIYFHEYPRRLRALVGDRVVLDTLGARLLHETGLLPVPYIPLADFDADLLERSDHTTHCPFKGDASYWHVRAGDTLVENAVWAYEEPLAEASWLDGFGALYWSKATAWFLEEEYVFGHLRDPFHRVDVLDSSRPVTVRVDGRVIARCDQPKLLYETGLPARAYIPRSDVVPGALADSDKRAACPYKGESRYLAAAGVADAGWTYDAPLPDAIKVKGHVCFDGEKVDVELGAPRAQLPSA